MESINNCAILMKKQDTVSCPHTKGRKMRNFSLVTVGELKRVLLICLLGGKGFSFYETCVLPPIYSSYFSCTLSGRQYEQVLHCFSSPYSPISYIFILLALNFMNKVDWLKKKCYKWKHLLTAWLLWLEIFIKWVKRDGSHHFGFAAVCSSIYK